jgi:hypothetical protein
VIIALLIKSNQRFAQTGRKRVVTMFDMQTNEVVDTKKEITFERRTSVRYKIPESVLLQLLRGKVIGGVEVPKKYIPITLRAKGKDALSVSWGQTMDCLVRLSLSGKALLGVVDHLLPVQGSAVYQVHVETLEGVSVIVHFEVKHFGVVVDREEEGRAN